MAPTTENIQSSSEVLGTKRIASPDVEWNKLYLSEEEKQAWLSSYAHRDLLPNFPDIKWPALEEFEYQDKALLADPDAGYSHLLRDATSVRTLNPRIGTEISGVDLSNLDSVQRNELALLVSRRQVVVFKKQTSLDVRSHIDLASYYGPLHKHLISGVPRDWESGLDVVHVLYTGPAEHPFQTRTPKDLWHADVTFENQPTGYSSIKILTTPEKGAGDTLFTSGYALYDSLSPAYRQYLSTLSATHSSEEQAAFGRKRNLPVRRDPTTVSHPVIRTHPVTGHNTVFVNSSFTRKIVDIPEPESANVLKYLLEQVATQQDATIRVAYENDDVVIWDNRSVFHSATYGHWPQIRHGYRVSSQAEKPYYDSNGTSEKEKILKSIEDKKHEHRSDFTP